MQSHSKFWLRATVSALAVCVAADAAAVDFNFSGAIVSYIIPASGTYQILAEGAQGGNSGGLGGQASGVFSFTIGDTVNILVGGAGGNGDFTGGGGGGSFVVLGGNALAVGGGGGGASGFSASATGAALGSSAGGGTGSGGFAGAGGGGFNALSNGASTGFVAGGASYLNGGGGGAGWSGNDGGFGGGGGGDNDGSGGGGGYVGGQGGGYSSGPSHAGLSFLLPSAVNQLFLAGGDGIGEGNGFVSINAVNAVAEPATLGLFGLSLAGLALMRRRRQV